MVRFRNVYHKICAFELNDHLKKVAKDCPDVKTAKYAVFYGFIDPEKGLMLELLGTAKSGKTRLNINEPYSGKPVTISISEIESDCFWSAEPKNFPKYASHIEAVKSDFISDEIERSRNDNDIDPFRDAVFPDRIYVRLIKGDLDREKILVSITGMTAHEFLGNVLTNPKQKFGIKKGDEIRFTIERGDDYKPVDCIADLDNNEPDSASANRYKYQLDDGLISSSEKVILRKR